MSRLQLANDKDFLNRLAVSLLTEAEQEAVLLAVALGDDMYSYDSEPSPDLFEEIKRKCYALGAAQAAVALERAP